MLLTTTKIILFLVALAEAAPAFELNKIFGDSMVLQHSKPSVIFGFDSPGSVVSVGIGGGNSYQNSTDSTGIWRVVMDAHGMGGPHSISILSSSGGNITLEDVYFGSVYICGGQSNMQFSLNASLGGSGFIADSINHPLIRVFTVGQGSGMRVDHPLQQFLDIEQPWAVASPSSVGHGDFSYFSALCYLFAREVQASLGEPTMPMGMISDNWGGTCLSSWAPSDGRVATECAKCTGTSGCSNLYNAMIAPLTVGPLAIEGFLWSQGECDADCNNTQFYECAFPRFIEDWRGAFSAPEALFSFQVLPAYVNDSGRFNPYSLPYERAAQLEGLKASGGMVHATNTIDCGDALAPYGSVHPRDKLTVAKRMAAGALAMVYYNTTIPYLSPAYQSATLVDSNSVQIDFSPTPPASGLLSLRPAACPAGVGGLPASECSWFEIQTVDGLWHNATGVSLSPDSKSLLLSANDLGGQKMNATRGFFSPWPVVVLFSMEGLPVLPWWEAF